jgi:hypothetical protein
MDVLKYFADISTIIGGLSVPIALFVFYFDRKKEKRNREMQSFNNLSTEWREYLKLLLDHPESDQYRHTFKSKNNVENEILVSMFESAFFHYTYYSGDSNLSIWGSWERYLDETLKIESFRNLCEEVVKHRYYSDKFNELLETKLKAYKEAE